MVSFFNFCIDVEKLVFKDCQYQKAGELFVSDTKNDIYLANVSIKEGENLVITDILKKK